MKTLVYFLIMFLSSLVGESVEEKRSECTYTEPTTTCDLNYVVPETKSRFGSTIPCEEGPLS